MKKLYNTPEMLISAFSPKADIAAVGISTPEEEIEDTDDTSSKDGE